MNTFKLTKAFLLIFFVMMYSCYNLSPRRPGPRRMKGGQRSGNLRVKDGRDVSPGQFTYIVRIELLIKFAPIPPIWNEPKHIFNHVCTGSVLTQTATLTAGHCCGKFFQRSNEMVMVKLIVRYGSAPGPVPIDQRVNDKFSDILNVTTPPARWGTDHPLFSDDIAILTTEPIQLMRYGKISSLDYPSLLGLHVAVTGYGDTNHSSHSDTLSLGLPLQVLDGMIMQCEDSFKFPMLCTKPACRNPLGLAGPGDSGGPVVHYSGIIGVNSKALFEAYRSNSDYVPVIHQVELIPLSPYIDWITRELLQHNTNW